VLNIDASDVGLGAVHIILLVRHHLRNCPCNRAIVRPCTLDVGVMIIGVWAVLEVVLQIQLVSDLAFGGI